MNNNKAIFGASLDFVSSEAYNVLRTNLSFSVPAKDTGKIVGITSPNPQEGKSFTTINLGYSLAKDGHKTIILSCDLRIPSLEKSLKVAADEGMSNILAGNAKQRVEQIIVPNILHENLSLLPAGKIPPNPSELLGSENMRKLLEYLGNEYEYILVDLPPVNSVIDPIVISKFIDGMIVVVRGGVTKKQGVMSAITQLRYANVRILGFVFNEYHSNGNNSSYRKYQYYKKYYKKSHGRYYKKTGE